MGNVAALYAIISLCMSFGCAQAQVNPKKILIVYLSRTENTKTVAAIIQQHAGGKLVALELKVPYPQNYKATVAQVVKENETGFLPPLKTTIDSIGHYDVVFIGFPTWDMQMPPPMKSFLRRYNLRGKTVIPFNTNAGYGVGSGFETVKALCPGSTVLQGFEIKAGAEKNGEFLVLTDERATDATTKVKQWLQHINMIP